MHIAIIGGGAAGCFAAINIKRQLPGTKVTVYESGRKPLAKVAVTGGGRCNLTNSFANVTSMEEVYPRGARLMKRLLKEFGNTDTCRWFEREGVRLVTQEDQCVFPKSQDAMEIVHTLTRLMAESGVRLFTAHRLKSIIACHDSDTAVKPKTHYRLLFANNTEVKADIVVVTTGGCNTKSAADMFDGLKLNMVPSVASLFSICLPGHDITELMGTVVENVSVGIVGTKMRASGALLITHWGMSGPAILRLSSYAARLLHDNGYKAQLTVNWLGDRNEQMVAEMISSMAINNSKKQLSSVYPQVLNSRLWLKLLAQSGLKATQQWSELGRKSINRLASTLTNNIYTMNGKNRFKEEFVTCGGVALPNISPSTLECKTLSGLFFAGEVLDVDAVTGGFNLQAAWTMGFVVAKAIAARDTN